MQNSKQKIDAIYELRDAAEEKALAELAAAHTPSVEHRDRLLEAQMRLEAKTQRAIEVCHECGRAHAEDASHADAASDGGNVLPFRTLQRPAGE